MINIKWLSSFSQSLSLLLPLSLSALLTTPILSGQVTLIVTGHIGKGGFFSFFFLFLLSLFFSLPSCPFFFFSKLSSLFSFLPNSHLFGSFGFSFFNSVLKFFKFSVVLLPQIKVSSD